MTRRLAFLFPLVCAACASQYPGTFSERYACHKQAYDQAGVLGPMMTGILVGGVIGGALAGSGALDSPSPQSTDEIYRACMAALQ